MKTVDCRGQACPAPVIATKKALESDPAGVTVLVDSGAPQENVSRFARNRGYSVDAREDAGGWSLLISATASEAVPATERTLTQSDLAGHTILNTSEMIGNGSEELGRLLMRTFIFTLLETSSLPERIILLNSGVLLATSGAETSDPLNKLVAQGVELFSCGVCLDYYGKKDQLAAGQVTNMFSVAENLLSDSRVVTL